MSLRARPVASLTLAASLALAVAIPDTTPAWAVADEPVQTQVVHGRDARPGEFGFLLAIGDRADYQSSGWGRAQFCGGTLAAPTLVITAAHCVVDRGRVERPGRLLIGVPEPDGSLTGESTIRRVTRIHVNPEYRERNTSGDLAVLVLDSPLDGLPTLLPATRAEARDLVPGGSPAAVAGWGSTRAGFPDGRGYPRRFQVGDLVTFPRSSCGGGQPFTIRGVTFRGWSARDVDASTMLCAQGVQRGLIVDSCVGDSGGPLVAGTGTSQRLVGVVSWGPERCASRQPGVYTRVSTFTDFLRSVGVPLGPPDAPTITRITVGESTATVTVTPAATRPRASSIVVTAVDAAGEATSCTTSATPPAAATCTLTALTSGERYTVTAVAIRASAASPPSSPRSIQPG